jgi:hypothetical protein
LPTSRNVIIACFCLAAVCIALGLVELSHPPDSGGLAADSYGTRSRGQRALFETMEVLGVPIERSLVPPSAHLSRLAGVALLGPDPDLMAIEGNYLAELGGWARDGGGVVAALWADEADCLNCQGIETGLADPPTSPGAALALLGLPGVDVQSEGTDEHAGFTRKFSPREYLEEDSAAWGFLGGKPEPPETTATLALRGEGALAAMGSGMTAILPLDRLGELIHPPRAACFTRPARTDASGCWRGCGGSAGGASPCWPNRGCSKTVTSARPTTPSLRPTG